MCQQDHEAEEKKLMTPQAPENKKRQVGTMSELLNILKKKNKLPLPKMEIERCPEILKKKNEQPPQKMEIQRRPGYDEHTQLAPLVVDKHITEGRHNVIRPAISEEGAGLICMPPSPQPLLHPGPRRRLRRPHLGARQWRAAGAQEPLPVWHPCEHQRTLCRACGA